MNKDLEKLIKLNEAKDKFRMHMKKNLDEKENYDEAKKLYEKYALLYREITGENPSKSFEELIDIK